MKELDFLRSLSVSKQAQSDLAAAIIQSLTATDPAGDEYLTPLVRFASLVTLRNAVELAMSDVAAEAEAYCANNHLGDDGKNFVHHNLVFQRQFIRDYNYLKYDDTGELQMMMDEYEQHGAERKSLTIQINRRKQDILAAHPKMPPMVLRTAMKYQETAIERSLTPDPSSEGERSGTEHFA